MFSTFHSWEEIGAWYSNLERERRAPTAEVRAQADEIVRGQTNDLDKIRALYEWVSRNIRYVSLSFGVGRYQPHAAAEVLQNRYGDCKDKTTLLEAMFEAEGFHGLPVLINSKAEIDPDVPTPLQFDHAITFISLNGTIIGWTPRSASVRLVTCFRSCEESALCRDWGWQIQTAQNAMGPSVYRRVSSRYRRKCK